MKCFWKKFFGWISTGIIAATLLSGCGAPGSLVPLSEVEKASFAPTKIGDTVIRDEAALRKLMGEHLFSLQWISWEEFGVAKVYVENDQLRITARQEGGEGSAANNFVTVDGVITEVADGYFLLNGKIISQVSFINNGAPCEREGLFTFGVNFNRKYWRLQEMANPCEDGNTVDYIDVFFARPDGDA